MDFGGGGLTTTTGKARAVAASAATPSKSFEKIIVRISWGEGWLGMVVG